MNITEVDWQTMKSLSAKLKVPMIQLNHDMITIYVGFIYGVDHANYVKLQRDLDLIATELKKCREKLQVYIERVGEINMEHWIS